jgi:hypothetical protein
MKNQYIKVIICFTFLLWAITSSAQEPIKEIKIYELSDTNSSIKELVYTQLFNENGQLYYEKREREFETGLYLLQQGECTYRYFSNGKVKKCSLIGEDSNWSETDSTIFLRDSKNRINEELRWRKTASNSDWKLIVHKKLNYDSNDSIIECTDQLKSHKIAYEYINNRKSKERYYWDNKQETEISFSYKKNEMIEIGKDVGEGIPESERINIKRVFYYKDGLLIKRSSFLYNKPSSLMEYTYNKNDLVLTRFQDFEYKYKIILQYEYKR